MKCIVCQEPAKHNSTLYGGPLCKLHYYQKWNKERRVRKRVWQWNKRNPDMKVPLPAVGVELPRRTRKDMGIAKARVITDEGYLTIGETENWTGDDLMRYFFGRPRRRGDKSLDFSNPLA